MDDRNVGIIISGQVQGVYFRAYTKEKADELGLTGYVRNKPEGGVQVEATGPAEAIEKFIAWCHVGSPRSVVEAVEVTEGTGKIFSDFTILR